MTSKTPPRDAEYRSFLLDYADNGVFAPRSSQVRIIRLVANHGLAGLDFAQSQIWYETILPVLSKPMSEQLLISAIKRNGGRVPRRVGEAFAADDLHPFELDTDFPGGDAHMPTDPASPHLLTIIAKALRASVREENEGPQAGASGRNG